MRFILIILLYGGVQFYVALNALHAFAPTWNGSAALLWAGLMIAAPMLHWRLERCRRCHVAAVVSAWLVFGWMGFSFLFFWFGLAFDLYAGVAHLAGWPVADAQAGFVATALLTSAAWLAGWYSARHPQVERVAIASDKLARGHCLRIALISDVHLGIMIGRQGLDRILTKLDALQPDVLVSTGDLVDAEAHHLNGLSERFAAYRPRLGKFAITGNHEAYAGLAHALDFHLRAGFTLLRGEHAALTDAITLAGVDDPATRAAHADEAAMLATIAPERFVLLLKHQPLIHPQSRFDLQLSGHTHKGQIFPFALLVKTVYPLIAGRYDLSNGRQLYVSRGTGTWGPPIRILAPAEISLIELRSSR